MANSIIAIDLDGTICETCWNESEALNAEPIEGMIQKVNQLSAEGNFIIIYTARKDSMIPATLKWLRQHNVDFDAICNNKMVADAYIDDKNRTFEEVLGNGD